MPTIRVDDDVYRELQGRAKPFVDSPNDVLRRMLELSALVKVPVRRVSTGRVRRTPDSAYRLPVLQSLVELGGRGSSRDVLAGVERLMKNELGDVDYEQMQSGQPRWASAAGFARLHMTQMTPPMMEPDTPRGVWAITKAGRQYVEARAVAGKGR